MVVHTLPHSSPSDPFSGRKAAQREFLSFRDVWRFISRYSLMLAFFVLLGLTIGIFYVVNTEATFLATTRLVMDPEQGRISWQDATTGAIIIETAEIASQVEIVKSETVAQTVIRKLDLTNDKELLASKSWLSRIRGLVSSLPHILTNNTTATTSEADVDPEAAVMRRTMAAFLSRVTVQRVGQSYVLEIGYTSTDPQKAALVANTLARAYIQVGMNDRADMARSGAKWLESRLLEVGQKAREASMSAEEFRSKNNITVIGNQSTLNQQQLSEVSTQLLTARAATAAEIANLNNLMEAMKSKAGLDLANPAIDSSLQKLREELRTAQTRIGNLRSRYSPGNPAIVAADAEMARIESAIGSEVGRLEAIYRSNLATAQTREHMAQDRLAVLTKTTAQKNEAVAELSEIESRANTYKRIYESLLQQLVGTVQTQSFPLGKARIVTAATAPLSKTWPKTSVIVPFSGVIGLSFGFFVAMLRQNLNHRVSSADHLRRELGITSLGHVPVYRARKGANNAAENVPQSIALLRGVVDMPYSPFAEALRSVKNSVDSAFPEEAFMVVGVTSVSSGEGKTTICMNLAQLYRNEGRSVVLIDADFLSSRLSRMVTTFPADLAIQRLPSVEPTAATEASLPEFVRDGGVLTVKKSRTRSAPRTTVVSLQAVPVLTTAQIKEQKSHHQHYGHLPALRSAIEKLRMQYNVVIVDMHAFESSADTRAICTYVDGIVVVLGHSKKMTIERLSSALATFGRSRLTILGSISNCSDQR